MFAIINYKIKMLSAQRVAGAAATIDDDEEDI